MSISQKNTLIVGEENFTYSLNYVQLSRNETVFSTSSKHRVEDNKIIENVKHIQQKGGEVMFDVDVTKLQEHKILQKYIFSRIIFNFPHLTMEMDMDTHKKLVSDYFSQDCVRLLLNSADYNSQQNNSNYFTFAIDFEELLKRTLMQQQKLVASFFKSATQLLTNDGKIQLTLCQGQGGTECEEVDKFEGSFKIVYSAATCNMILCEIRNNEEHIDVYRNPGYGEYVKSFSPNSAVTHIFCRGEPYSFQGESPITDPFPNMQDNISMLCGNIQNMFFDNSNKPDMPYTRALNVVLRAMVQFHSLVGNKYFFRSLIFCKSPEDIVSTSSPARDYDMCNSCLSSLLTLFAKDVPLMSFVICSVSCINSFHVNETPLTHYAIYYASRKEYLQVCLISIFRKLMNDDLLKIRVESWSDFVSNIQGVREVNYDNLRRSSAKGDNIKTVPIFAFYDTTKSNCLIIHTDLNVVITHDKHDGEYDKVTQIGCLIDFSYNGQNFFMLVLDLDAISIVRFHMPNYRVLYSDAAYYVLGEIDGNSVSVYRPLCMYPPVYELELCFSANEVFIEKYFFAVLRNTLGLLVEKVKRTITCNGPGTVYRSRQYRISYSSYDRPLSHGIVNYIHRVILKHVVEKSFKVTIL